jgi:hypothetical protein
VQAHIARGHNSCVLCVVRLRLLQDLAKRWCALLVQPQEGLTMELFDDNAEDHQLPVPADSASFGRAIIAGCRRRLLTDRAVSLHALREGFTETIDLSIQLGAFATAELLLMLRGRACISCSELLECFEGAPALSSALSSASHATDAADGFDAPRYLLELIAEGVLDAKERLDLLEWATALRALPCGGLKERIRLRPYEGATDEDLPMVHTCSLEVHLPACARSARLALGSRDRRALASAHTVEMIAACSLTVSRLEPRRAARQAALRHRSPTRRLSCRVKTVRNQVRAVVMSDPIGRDTQTARATPRDVPRGVRVLRIGQCGTRASPATATGARV